MVAVELLKNSIQVDKLILCGIPIEDFQEDSRERYQALHNFDTNKVFLLQNDKDHHEYPYLEDFVSFLSGK